MKYTANRLKNTLRRMNYKVFTRPYELNLIGLRTTSEPNTFNDTMAVFYNDDNGQTIYNEYPITTDPGTYWLNKPMNVKGTAMLKAGQYIDTWIIGPHLNKYTALVQRKPVTVYRDNDRNSIFQSNVEDTGLFGINIHKAGSDSKSVDKWSAGCQVFKRVADFNTVMKLAEEQRKRYGNKFTYTLLDAVEVEKKKRRRFLYFVGAVSLGTFLYFNYERKK